MRCLVKQDTAYFFLSKYITKSGLEQILSARHVLGVAAKLVDH